MTILTTLASRLRLDVADFHAGTVSAQRDVSTLTKSVEGANKKFSLVGAAAAGFTSAFVGGGIFNTVSGLQNIKNGVTALTGALIGGNAAFEDYGTRFKVMLGSADAAQTRMAELADFGAKTPFELPGVVQADIVLQGFGLHSEEAAKKFGYAGSEIRTIAGDVASGTGAAFDEMTLLIGKFSSGATGEAISRMMELGITSRDELAKMGLEFSKSGELLSPLPQAMNTVLTVMKNKYGGLMDAQSETFNGMMSNLADWRGGALRIIGAPLFEVLRDKLKDLLKYLNSPQVMAALNSFAKLLAAGLGATITFFTTSGIPTIIKFGKALYTIAGPAAAFAKSLYNLSSNSEQLSANLNSIVPGAGLLLKLVQGLTSILVNDFVPVLIAVGVTFAAWNLSSITSSIVALTAKVILGTTAWTGYGVAMGILSTGPFVVLALAIYGLIKAVQHLNEVYASGTDKLLESREWWRDSTDALNTFATSAAASSEAVKPLANSLEELRATQEAELTSLAKRMAAGNISSAQYAEEMGAINARAEAIRQSTADLELAIQATDAATYAAENGTVPAYIQYLGSDVPAAAGAMTTALALSEEELQEIAKQIDNAAQEGTKALSDWTSSTVSFQNDMASSATEHWANLASLHKAWADASTKDERAAIQERIDAELTGYATSQQNAAVAYAQEAAAHRAHLGEMLIDTVNSWMQAGEIPVERAKEMNDKLAAEFGVAADNSTLLFGSMVGDLTNWKENAGVSADGVIASLDSTMDVAVDTQQTMDKLTGIYVAKLVQNFNEGKIDADEFTAALGRVPATVTSMLQTNFESQLAAIRGVGDAMSKLPVSKLIQIEAIIDPDLRRHSPAPIEQVMATIEDFERRSHTIKIDTEGLERLKKIVDVVQSLGGAAESLGKAGAYSSTLGTGASISALIADASNMVEAIQGIASKFKKEGVDAAAEWATASDKILKLVGSVVDAVTKLSEYKTGVVTQMIVSRLAYDLYEIVSVLQGISEKFENEGVATAAAWAESADKILKLSSSAVDAVTKLLDYKGGTITAFNLSRFAGNLYQIVKTLSGIAAMFDAEGVKSGAVFSESASRILSLVGPALDAIVKLMSADDKTVPRASINAFIANIVEIVTAMSDSAALLSTEGVQSGAVYAEAVGKMIAPIISAIETFTKLRDYKGVAPWMIDMLGADIRLLVDKMVDIAAKYSIEGVQAAAAFGDATGKIVAPIGAAIDTFNKVVDYKGIDVPKFLLLASDLMGVLGHLIELAKVFRADGVSAAVSLADSWSKIATGIGSGIDLLNKFTNYEGPDSDSIEKVFSDMQAVLARATTAATDQGALTGFNFVTAWQSRMTVMQPDFIDFIAQYFHVLRASGIAPAMDIMITLMAIKGGDAMGAMIDSMGDQLGGLQGVVDSINSILAGIERDIQVTVTVTTTGAGPSDLSTGEPPITLKSNDTYSGLSSTPPNPGPTYVVENMDLSNTNYDEANLRSMFRESIEAFHEEKASEDTDMLRRRGRTTL